MAEQVRALEAGNIRCLTCQVSISGVEFQDLHQLAGIQPAPAEIFAVHPVNVLEQKILRQS